MKAFLIDLEGTIVKDKSFTPIEGAIEFIKTLKKRNIPFLIASNNSTHKLQDLVKALREKGFPLEEKDIVTPSKLALEHLKKENIKKIIFLGTENIKEFFEENQIEVKLDKDVDAVVVGRDKEINAKKLKMATSALVLNNAKLFGFHKNRLIKDEDGLVSPSVGAILECLKYASKKDYKIFGKPAKEYFDICFKILNVKNPKDVYMISDDPFTDLAEGKKNAGFKTIFVTSGKYNESILKELKKEEKPDFVYPSVKEILEDLDRLL